MKIKKTMANIVKKKYKNIFIYAHDDLDGRCSAILVNDFIQKYNYCMPHITYINYNNLDFRNEENELYVFLDLKLDHILKKYSSYIYIDHHSKHTSVDIQKNHINITTLSFQSTYKTLSNLLNISTKYDVNMVNEYDTGNPSELKNDTEIYTFFKEIYIYYCGLYNIKSDNFNEINFLTKEALYHNHKIALIDLHKYTTAITYKIIKFFPDLLMQMMFNYIKLYLHNTEAVIFMVDNKISARVIKEINVDKIIGKKLRGHERARALYISDNYQETINNIKLNIMKYNNNSAVFCRVLDGEL